MKASGESEVKLVPLEAYTAGGHGNQLGQMSIDKIFHGDLDAVRKGEMLNAMTAVKGSAGYVATEQISGKLAGKSGGFILQHFGIINGGADRLMLEVVPDSGTGELNGISGQMKIIITDGKHVYKFDYELP